MLKRFVLPRAAEDGGSGAAPAVPDTAPPPAAGEGAPTPSPARQESPPPAKPALTAASYADLKTPQDLPLAPAAGLESFKGLFAELGIAPAAAQKLVDLQAGLIRSQSEEARQNAETTARAWANTAATDREYGGSDFARNAGLARQALQAFATPDLVGLLDQTGLGNHPELIRAFYRVGKAMQEDGRIAAAAAPRPDRLAALYPTMVSKE